MGVGADLRFEVSAPGRDSVRGSLRGSGSALVLEVSDASLLAGTAGSGAGRALAEAAAARGVSVRVVSRGVHLTSLGAVSAPWWQRLVTGSRRIRLGSPRGTWMARSALRGRASLLPDLSTVPTTVLPLVPTFRRPRRRPIATTHGQGGAPRLIVLPGDRATTDDRQLAFALVASTSSIGSDASCDIVLPGLLGRHAAVEHDEADEYVLLTAPGADVRVNGVRGPRLLLRTGSRVQLGSWALAFTRQESADHGRPHGGRSGGEVGHQRPQQQR